MYEPLYAGNHGIYTLGLFCHCVSYKSSECIHSNICLNTYLFAEVILTRSFASVTQLEGRTITLSCMPSVIETVLSWSHDGTNVNEDENTSFSPVNLNHNLILDNSDVRDSGQYTCRAELENEVVEQSITVTVVAGMYVSYISYNCIHVHYNTYMEVEINFNAWVICIATVCMCNVFWYLI